MAGMIFDYDVDCGVFPAETFFFWLAVWSQEWVWQKQDKAAACQLQEAEAHADLRRGARVH